MMDDRQQMMDLIWMLGAAANNVTEMQELLNRFLADEKQFLRIYNSADSDRKQFIDAERKRNQEVFFGLRKTLDEVLSALEQIAPR